MLESWPEEQDSFRKTDGIDLPFQRGIHKGGGACDRMQQVQ
jgi:hypothetical protein